MRFDIGPGTETSKIAAISAVQVKGMGEGKFSDYGEELYPPVDLAELSLKEIIIGDGNSVDSFRSTVENSADEKIIFKADESDISDITNDKEVDPFDDLENAMQ